MKKIEKITSIHNAWRPSDIAFIKALKWSINNLVIVCYCQLRDSVSEWPNMSNDFFEVTITFKNISGLKLDFNGTGLHQILGFDILDISDNGLEKINFQIEDYENDTISFCCEEVEINVMNDPGKIVFV